MSSKSGQPTKYTQKVQESADRYLCGGYKEVGDIVPSISGLARHLDVTRPTLINWREAHGQFFTTFKKIVEEQERQLINGGLSSDMNATIVKLMMANHGYSDKSEVDNRSSDGSMSPKPVDLSNLSKEQLQVLASIELPEE